MLTGDRSPETLIFAIGKETYFRITDHRILLLSACYLKYFLASCFLVWWADLTTWRLRKRHFNIIDDKLISIKSRGISFPANNVYFEPWISLTGESRLKNGEGDLKEPEKEKKPSIKLLMSSHKNESEIISFEFFLCKEIKILRKILCITANCFEALLQLCQLRKFFEFPSQQVSQHTMKSYIPSLPSWILLFHQRCISLKWNLGVQENLKENWKAKKAEHCVSCLEEHGVGRVSPHKTDCSSCLSERSGFWVFAASWTQEEEEYPLLYPVVLAHTVFRYL